MMNSYPKIVFSKTLEKAEWNNSRIVKENISEDVSKLKNQSGKDIIMWGGVGIAHTFIQLRLIDEYRLNFHPVMLGSGLSLFKDNNDKIKLKL
ncbi:MAG: dihydrofolate reductase family protein [Acidobacteriota bacterium]|nr:dihydrofolate reductase family protein [Acidobacteriota bacterium]